MGAKTEGPTIEAELLKAESAVRFLGGAANLSAPARGSGGAL